MKRLYKAENNAMNYVIIEDTENNTACIFDWDLSDDEIVEITDKFKNGKLTKEDFNNTEWENTEEVFSNLWGIELLAY